MLNITAMKQLCLLSLILVSFPVTILPQSCLPEGITFTNQAQIDSFQVNYPGCTEIEGNVSISDYGTGDIHSLIGLNVLNLIAGDLEIWFSPSLTHLTGLENLTYIGGGLVVKWNDSLINLSGLNGITSIGGGLDISENYNLNSIIGLDNLTIIGGNCSIWALDNLTSLIGLEDVAYVAGDLGIAVNPIMTSFNGISNLTGIGGNLTINCCDSLTTFMGLEILTSIGGSITINDNQNLISITGLDNIDAGSITDIYIVYNLSLSTCEIQSICNYLAAPNGEIDIELNAPGCNSQEEVEYACGVGLDEILEGKDCNVFPNPSSDLFTISFTLDHPTPVRLEVINRIGQVVEVILNGNMPQGEQQVTWNAEGVPAGVYIYRFATNDRSSTGKLVITR